jgi:hypothetical protein
VLAILAAIAVTTPVDASVKIWGLWFFKALNVIWIIAGVLMACAPLLLNWLLDGQWSPAAAGLMVIVLAGLFIFPKLLKQRSPFYPWSVLAFAVLFSITAFGIWLPHFDQLWPTRKAAAMVHRYEQAAGHPVRTLSLGYAEPSLAFMLGTRTGIEWDMVRVLNELKTNPNAVVIVQDVAEPLPRRLPVPDKLWQALNKGLTLKARNCFEPAFLAATTEAGLKLHKQESMDGYNYSKGKRVKLTLYVQEHSL